RADDRPRSRARRAHRRVATRGRPVIAAHPEPHAARMLVESGGSVVNVAPEGTRTTLVANAQDAAYSPDGALRAFRRGGRLWLANGEGRGEGRLGATPQVDEWGPSWLADGSGIVYTARTADARQIRVYRLPTGPSSRLAPSGAEEYGATISSNARLAFVSTR